MEKLIIKLKTVKTKIISLFLVLTFLVSCSDFLDVNTDPNAVTDNPGIYLLPQIELSIVGNYGGVYALHGSLWAQYYNQNNTANQYRRIIDMQVLSGDVDRNWNDLYANALSDIKKLKEFSETVETYNPRLFLIATVLESFTYQIIFDAHGQAPYTDAIKGESDNNFNPAFDDGEVVYPQLVAAIDAALLKYNTYMTENPSANPNLGADVAKNDFIFNGDLAMWLAFANSVKLKLAVRNYDYDTPGSTAIIQALELENNYITMDAMVDIFETQKDKQNPLYAIDQNLNTKINLVANRTLSEFWTTNLDPREALTFKANTSGNLLLDHGDHRASSTTNPPLSNRTLVLDATRPAYLMTTSEVDFFRAELVARGIVPGDAKAYYDAAVTSAFVRVGATAADAATLIGAGGNYEFRATEQEQLEDIGVQKWAAMANVNPFEGFLEVHRMDYPEILEQMTYEADLPEDDPTPQPTGNGGAKLYLPKNTVLALDYIKRYMLPEAEQTSNASFPGQTKVTDKLWWDTK